MSSFLGERVEILVIVHPEHNILFQSRDNTNSPVDLVVSHLGDVLDVGGEPPAVLVVVPEVVPVAAAPGTVVPLPDEAHPVTPVVVTPVGDLANVHVRGLDIRKYF